MNNEMPSEPTPEELLKQQEERAEDERLADWLERHPEPVVVQKNADECGPDIREYFELITSFELNHPLEALHAITDLTQAEAQNHPTWKPAWKALIPIYEKLKELRKQNSISGKELEEINAAYKRCSQAVGSLNKGIVDHTR